MKGKGTRLMQLVNVVVSSSKLLSDQKTSDCQIMRIMRAPCRRDKRIIALRSLKELSCSHLDMMLVVGLGETSDPQKQLTTQTCESMIWSIKTFSRGRKGQDRAPSFHLRW